MGMQNALLRYRKIKQSGSVSLGQNGWYHRNIKLYLLSGFLLQYVSLWLFVPYKLIICNYFWLYSAYVGHCDPLGAVIAVTFQALLCWAMSVCVWADTAAEMEL